MKHLRACLHPLTPILVVVIVAACGSTGGKGTTIGFFPTEVTGTASQVVGCGAFGLAEDDAVLIALTGNRITVKDDSDFDFDCRGTIFGTGDMTFGAATVPEVSGFDFRISAKTDCNDLDDLDWTDLARVSVELTDEAPATVVDCVDLEDAPLGPRLACTLDTTCTFDVLDPLIVYQFDLEEALEDALEDAFF
jgi:hypothetical protein